MPDLIWLPNESETLAKLPHYTCPANGVGVNSWNEWFKDRAVPAIPWLDGETSRERDRVLILLVPLNTPTPNSIQVESRYRLSFERQGLHYADYRCFAVWKKDYICVSGVDWPRV